MALRQKYKGLKSISGKTDIGGAPFHGNDFVTIQENAKADIYNFFQEYNRRLGNMLYYRGPSTPAEALHKFGLVVSGMEYDNSDPANPVLNEGYFFSEGELCYFPGLTWSITSPLMVFIRKGALLTESRVFNDGVSKEFLVEYGYEIHTSTYNTFGPSSEPLSSPDLTKEYIVITLGNAVGNYINFYERNCTIESSIGLIKLEEAQEYPDFTAGTPSTGWALTSDYHSFFGSRVCEKKYTHIGGAVKKTFAGTETGTVSVGTINSENLNWGLGELPIHGATVKVGTTYYTDFIVLLAPNGQISITPRTGTTTYPAGDMVIFFNCIILGHSNIYNHQYQYTPNFKDDTI